MINPIQQFYNQNSFPGFYNMDELLYHVPKIKNPYLKIIDSTIQKNYTVLDIGCGTGYITNLLSLRHPDINLTGIDFSNGIDHAIEFAKKHYLNNVHFIKKDFLDFETDQRFDVVLAQGVLHHIPNFELAFEKAKSLVNPGGKLVVGLYHPWGKILKKYINLDYKSSVLEIDQEHNPYEMSYTLKSLNDEGIVFVKSFPRWPKIYACFNFVKYSLNGGLVTYVFEKKTIVCYSRNLQRG